MTLVDRNKLWIVAGALALTACGDDGNGSDGTAGSSSSGTSTTTTTTAATSTTTTTTGATGSTGAGSTGGMLECPYTEVAGDPTMTLEMVADGFAFPLLAIGDPTDPLRLFVVEKGGTIRILEPGATTAPAETFLDINVAGGGEEGLLGFAFHPDYLTDPRVYVDYIPAQGAGRTVIEEFTVDAGNPDQVDPASGRIIMELDQPFGNHNGGMIAFGPDRMLYIGTGDGGAANDPEETGQDPDALLGKILRIDPEPDMNPDNPSACDNCPQLGPFDYTIPADNPFVGMAGFAPEIYALGMRNPWRFSFDAMTDELYVADVGQNQWEEVDIVAAGGNYGWDDMEGNNCFEDNGCDESAGPNQANADGLIAPIVQYDHGGGRCSITGGATYRGCEVPGWTGRYIYGDLCSNDMWGALWDGAAAMDLGMFFDFGPTGMSPVGNGWNALGDVYITAASTFDGSGAIYRLAPE